MLGSIIAFKLSFNDIDKIILFKVINF